jgi:DNA-binding NarL/FixJ family response regulator
VPFTLDSAPGEAALGPPARCLIVEDDEISGATLAQLVMGYARYSLDEVIVCRSFGDARRARLAKRPAPEMIFTDLRLPDMEGVEVVSALRAAAPESKICVVSGTRDADIVRQCFRQADGFVCKADSSMAMRNALRMYFDDGYYFPRWARKD